MSQWREETWRESTWRTQKSGAHAWWWRVRKQSVASGGGVSTWRKSRRRSRVARASGVRTEVADVEAAGWCRMRTGQSGRGGGSASNPLGRHRRVADPQPGRWREGGRWISARLGSARLVTCPSRACRAAAARSRRVASRVVARRRGSHLIQVEWGSGRGRGGPAPSSFGKALLLPPSKGAPSSILRFFDAAPRDRSRGVASKCGGGVVDAAPRHR